MNIVISSLGINKTGVSSDLDSAKLFIEKSINNQKELIAEILLSNESSSYPLFAEQSSALEKNEFFGYRLVSRVSVPSGTYSLKIGDYKLDDFVIEEQETLIDEHDPVYIIGRKINPIKTEVVA